MRTARPTPPTRDPHTPGFVAAKELPDGTVPPADAYGNFIIGPTYTVPPEMTVQPNVPQGTVHNFTMSSADSKDTTAEFIAQFGTARESTLSMLRTLPDDEWDVTGDYPRSVRTDVLSLIDRDRKALDTIGQMLGQPLTEAATA